MEYDFKQVATTSYKDFDMVVFKSKCNYISITFCLTHDSKDEYCVIYDDEYKKMSEKIYLSNGTVEKIFNFIVSDFFILSTVP